MRRIFAVERWQLGALALITAWGAGLRLSSLSDGARYDEVVTYERYVSKSLKHGLSTYDVPNNHLFNSALEHVTWRLFGDDLWALRLPALIAGILMMPLGYLAGRVVYGRLAGLWAAGLVAVSAPLVEYSANGRGYTISTMLVLALLVLAVRILRRAALPEWIAFGVGSALAVWTIPTTVYGVAVVATWLALQALFDAEAAKRRHLLTGLAVTSLAAGVATLLLYVPVLGQPGWTYLDPVPVEWDDLGQLVSRIWQLWTVRIPVAVQVVLVAAFLGATLLHRRLGRQRVPLAASTGAVLVVVVVVAPLPPFARNWLFLLPLLLVVASGGLAGGWGALGDRVPAAAGLALPLAVSAALGVYILKQGTGTLDRPHQGEDVARFVKHRMPPGALVVVGQYTEIPLRYYFVREGLSSPVENFDSAPANAQPILALPSARGPKAALAVIRRAAGPPVAGAPRLLGHFREGDLYAVLVER